MRDFLSIIDVLKVYVSKNKVTKVLDKDVAKLLNMSQSRFATLKKRNTIPYENVLLFCKEKEQCCLEVMFD